MRMSPVPCAHHVQHGTRGSPTGDMLALCVELWTSCGMHVHARTQVLLMAHSRHETPGNQTEVLMRSVEARTAAQAALVTKHAGNMHANICGSSQVCADPVCLGRPIQPWRKSGSSVQMQTRRFAHITTHRPICNHCL